MALKFVLGPGTADHDALLQQQMAAVLQSDSHAEVLALVPNHIKFESEVTTLGALHQLMSPDTPTFAQSRIQVMSFTRLAWYYLKDQAVFLKPRLSPSNAAMRLSKIISDMGEQLHLYAGQGDNPGFTARLQKQLAELQMGGVTAADLQGAIAQLQNGSSAERQVPKLSDLATIMGRYEQETAGTVSQADLLAALDAKLAASDLSRTHVFISHFNIFAAQELQIVTTLMTKAADVTVALVTDSKPGPDLVDQDLYQPAKRLYQKLLAAARSAHVAVALDQQAPSRTVSGSISNVQRFFRADAALRPVPEPGQPFVRNAAGQPDFDDMRLFVASNTYTELRNVARDIRRRVQTDRTGKLRFRDFLVMARRLKPYETIVNAVFKEFELPVFIDHEQSMSQHPLLVFIDSLFGLAELNYDYQNVFALLRTELLKPADMSVSEFRQAVDTTENHVLATGLRGSAWTKDEDWRYYTISIEDDADEIAAVDAQKSVQINRIRRIIADTVAPFVQLLKQQRSAGELAQQLYSFLLQSGAQQTLADWRDQSNAAGDLAAAQAGEQAWGVFCDLLDDLNDSWGDTPITPAQFLAMLDAGFASATYTQIPSTLDQVQVSETGLTRLMRAKHVYIIGATSTDLPASGNDNELLTSSDRHVLEPVLPEGCFLPATGPDTALGEPFLNYLAFVAGSESLTISYPQRGESDNDASPYLLGLRIASGQTVGQWQPATGTEPLGAIVGTTRSLLSDTITALQQLTSRGSKIGPSWQAVITALRATPQSALVNQLLASLNYTNAAGAVSPDMARALYGRHLAVSISRLETFYKNPFEYFVQYGLGLNPRREFTLTPADTGVLFHSVLQNLLGEAQAAGGLGTIKTAELLEMVNRLLKDQLAKPAFAVLSSSARMQFIADLIRKTLERTAWAVHNEQKASGFAARSSELSFGMGDANGLPALQIPVDANQQVFVRGRIDRVDTLQTQNQETGFIVVDYKSSQHDFSAQDAYYGLGMQMLTYIEAIMKAGTAAGRDMIPAAGVFLRLQDPHLKYFAGSSDESRATQLLNDMRMRGLLVQSPIINQIDSEIVDEQDGTITAGKSSRFFPLKINKKDGKPAKGTNLVSLSEMMTLLNNNDELIRNAAAAILAGVIDLTPARFDQSGDVVTKSDYSSIMQFDSTLGGNNYRQLSKLSLEQVLERLLNGDFAYENQD
ncbi:PD-(D/E)XK nuclease family protein [Lacticaseibacillus songhuajiangensis]|uniref:PD-(D/E)XK nuclease family protein n=1 Tax=Lacticaseibacillus songhuajiangensis TaxID=1296539 RepID=UPI000F76D103|nr:PD-(D/E)XK nuclease family protein [Lacticaseibacillus songhuajiangensis]